MASDALLHYPDTECLFDAVADLAAAALRGAVLARGRAVLACSGGRTPPRYLRRLAELDVPWDAVIVTLTDDRNVAEDHPESNAGMVARELVARARGATFVGLGAGSGGVRDAVALGAEGLARAGIAGPDVSLLGLGEDGHVASVFPGLDPVAAVGPLIGVEGAPGVSERVSWSLDALGRASLSLLILVGESKRRVLVAERDRPLPVDLIRSTCCGTFLAAYSPAPPSPAP